MLKFMVVILATLMVCWGIYHWCPQVVETAFHIPKSVDGAKLPGIGGRAITWMMVVGGMVGLGIWKIVNG